MVFVLELDEDDSITNQTRPWHFHGNSSHHAANPAASEEAEERENPNINGFTASLCCYPIVCELARHLDLNSLHNLSLTCRQIRANLTVFRDQLIHRTLRCSKEDEDVRFPRKQLSIASGLNRVSISPDTSMLSRRMTTGKSGKCARDMVAECRKCGVPMCRNCIAKPPISLARALPARHRRMCRTCTRVPLSYHFTAHPQPRNSSRPSSAKGSSSSSLPRSTGLVQPSTPPPTPPSPPEALSQQPHKTAFTEYAYARTPCLCARAFYWLCPSCSSNSFTADTGYARVWRWRSAYANYTGVSEGNKGVECGRAAACAAARLVEQETSCDATDRATLESAAERDAIESGGRSWTGGGFIAQECEGAGGTVMMKHRKMVAVGAEVDMDDEEESEYSSKRVLDKEITGEVRSWCAWCERVIPAEAEGWDKEWEMSGC